MVLGSADSFSYIGNSILICRQNLTFLPSQHQLESPLCIPDSHLVYCIVYAFLLCCLVPPLKPILIIIKQILNFKNCQ